MALEHVDAAAAGQADTADDPVDVLPASRAGRGLGPALTTALAYAAVGAVALLLTAPPGHASPLYPSAGIALVAVLVWGRVALPGVLLGALAVNLGLGWQRGLAGAADLLLLPLAIGCGAALQAAAGAALVRRFVAQPLVLNMPRDILRFAVLGALASCTLSASVATAALLASGALPAAGAVANWLTWWVGDAMGVLIGAPLVLTLIGRPRADWRPRRRTLGLPLLLALALLSAGIAEFARLDRQRQTAAFERDADRLAAAAAERLVAPVHALQALHSAARARRVLDQETLRQAARWWLSQPLHLQAVGYSERVAVAALPAYEAAARAAGSGGFRVFDRDDGTARRADGEVTALRHVEPLAGNAGAVGINTLSIPAARSAILASRDSGEPAASAGFRLTQRPTDESGVVIYQALYSGEPTTLAERRAQFRGLVFVTLLMDATMRPLQQPAQRQLRWCLLDADPRAERRRLAGEPGCENAGSDGLQTRRSLALGGRPVLLHIAANPTLLPGRQREAAWLLAMAGLAAAAMLGALLLTVTGHTRRTQLAVHAGTAELRREMGRRAQAQQALADSESRLRSILDHVPLGVMFLDPRGQLIDGNSRLADMLGHPIAALRGHQVAAFVHDDDAARLRRLRRRLLVGAGDAVLERVRLVDGAGRELTARLSASALRAPDGRLLRLVAVLEDITEHLRLEQSERALHRAEAANRAKSEFLSRMSHELRTPLNAMIGFAQLLGLDREPALPPHQRVWTQEIQRAGWHLLEMINETLDLARIESGAAQLNLSPVALAPLVKACQAMVAHAAAQRGIAITQHIDTDAAVVVGDATRLKQVLINLLSNAVKYNREGGTVALLARRIPGLGPATAEAPRDGEDGSDVGDCVEIAVADSGLGMTPTQLGGLFQPYNRLGREASGIEGTGVGLVISRRLAVLMGGTLDVSSQAEQGSVFTLRLPAAAVAVAEAEPEYTDTRPAPYQQRLVHYVEDNETNVEVMRGVFVQRPQIRLETTALGLDGLAAIRRNPPDLVLLDMQLPDISGLELLRHLKQDAELASIPVVVVSADAVAGHMQRALTSGAQHYVTKPLDVARFLGTIDSILEQADTRWGL